MRTAGLAGKCPRRWRATTIADPAAQQRPDLIGRDFDTDAAAVDTRGCQYTSSQHARLAAAHGVRLSVGRRRQCWDNAVAESFFATIKTELLHRQPWPTHQAAKQAIFEYIEGWYNTRRRTSTLSVETGQAHSGLPPQQLARGRSRRRRRAMLAGFRRSRVR